MALTKEHLEILETLCGSWPYLNGSCFEYIAENFVNGDCYVFAKTVQLIIPETKLRFNRRESHVVVEMDGIVFDTIETHSNDYGSEFVDKEDDEYCICYFGYHTDFPQDNVFKIVSWVQNYLKNNLSEGQSSKVKKRLKDYLNMCKHLDIDEPEWNDDIYNIYCSVK